MCSHASGRRNVCLGIRNAKAPLKTTALSRSTCQSNDAGRAPIWDCAADQILAYASCSMPRFDGNCTDVFGLVAGKVRSIRTQSAKRYAYMNLGRKTRGELVQIQRPAAAATVTL